MKQNFSWRLLVGVGLIVLGLIALLQTLGLLKIGDWMWALLFFAGGGAFLSVVLANKQNWWGLIPGCTLLGIGGEILLGSLRSPVADMLSGVMVLGGIGLAFWLIFLLHPENWWAIIPGGVMTTLALVAVLGKTSLGMEIGGAFMLGLAATFALVALLTRKTTHSMKWAWYPAGILAVIGAIIMFSTVNLLGALWGLALVGVGGYMAWRSLKK